MDTSGINVLVGKLEVKSSHLNIFWEEVIAVRVIFNELHLIEGLCLGINNLALIVASILVFTYNFGSLLHF